MSGARDGGERDGLAPVIPLFGGAHHARRDDGAAEDATAEDRTVRDADRGGVTPFRDTPSTTWHTTWTDEQDSPESDAWDADTATRAQDAEAALVKRLRTRSLSEREARAFLRERDLADDAIEHVLARMRGLGYLDDAALAEQIVHSGVERKGQGRVMLAQALAKRGIPRDVVDEALGALPDDEAERALDFARQKARSLRDLDRDTALRRLSGQLARRGYGATALSAARQALDELGRPVRRPPAGTVRFD